ncbi:MAG: hypothetical protein WD749_12855 [Phycisphaerales bacterium]
MKRGARVVAVLAGVSSSASGQVTLPEASLTYTLSYTNLTTGAPTP